MSRFFINRPIFAWVIAIVIMVAGVLAITAGVMFYVDNSSPKVKPIVEPTPTEPTPNP